MKIWPASFLYIGRASIIKSKWWMLFSMKICNHVAFQLQLGEQKSQMQNPKRHWNTLYVGTLDWIIIALAVVDQDSLGRTLKKWYTSSLSMTPTSVEHVAQCTGLTASLVTESVSVSAVLPRFLPLFRLFPDCDTRSFMILQLTTNIARYWVTYFSCL